MSWAVEVTDHFEQWWEGLTEDERISIDGMIRVLESLGPRLDPPYSIETVGSRYRQLRQLRVPHKATEICVLYAADEKRLTLVLLVGATGATPPTREPCPPEQVALAESIFGKYLAQRNSD